MPARNTASAMRLQTVVRDCLYLNWAVPRDVLAEPPRPLRYESHRHAGETWVFASALLFHQSGLRLGPLPLAGLSYPQVNVRTYVSDAGTPAVLFHRMLVPGWAAPAVRIVARLPCSGARLRLARPSRETGAETWEFRAQSGEGDLAVTVRPGGPLPGQGPDLGSWAATTEYFRLRDRGFALSPGGLQRIDTAQETVPLWPVLPDVADAGLLAATLGRGGGFEGVLHSAWLCPEIPLSFVTSRAVEPVLPRQVPAPG